ncbi:DUF1707 and DUF2154 domain-containing protein, partial [Micromonospora aurantiaca]|nr:DUF1707 and DUF2154 domain-containing protein [Micromonospora aurantiaca]
IFGGNDLPEDDTVDPDAPVIRLTGMVLFGGVSVSRRAVGEKDRRGRHREMHELHREHHREIREMHRERHEELRRHRDERRER